MSEHEEEQSDPYADLERKTRQSERTRLVSSDRKFIEAARKRHIPWQSIAERFSARHGITISADHLRVLVERYSDTKTKKEKPEKRTQTEQKARVQRTKPGAFASRAIEKTVPVSGEVGSVARRTIDQDPAAIEPPAARTTASHSRSLPERL
jgi:hypothetical protein